MQGDAVNDLTDKQVERRNKILAMESALKQHQAKTGEEMPDIPITHHLSDGLYLRKMVMPVGALVIGKIHKHEHQIVVLSGHVLVVTEDGIDDLRGGDLRIYRAGIKRVLYADEETVWLNIHPTSKATIEEIEDELVTEDYATLGMKDTIWLS